MDDLMMQRLDPVNRPTEAIWLPPKSPDQANEAHNGAVFEVKRQDWFNGKRQ
jgi:hypothetical protein